MIAISLNEGLTSESTYNHVSLLLPPDVMPCQKTRVQYFIKDMHISKCSINIIKIYVIYIL